MIFVESYFERSLKQNVFDKLADDESARREANSWKSESECPCFPQAAGVVVFNTDNHESLILQNAKTSGKYVV